MFNFKAGNRRFRFWCNLSFAYVKRYKLWVLSALIIISAFIFASYKILVYLNRTNTLTVGYVGSYTIENIPSDILSLATDSLITKDENGRPVPQLASHWTMADEGKTYVVFLKDNLKWHDGTDVEAKDILVAISGVQITALNKKVIEFKLPNSIPSFPLLLNKPVFKAKSFYGTGEYRIVNINEIDNKVKKITLAPKNSKLPRVEIKFYSSRQQAINALKLGDIKRTTIASAGELQGWPNLDVERTVDNSEVVTVFYNTEVGSLASKEFRQALTYAINNADFDGQSANGPISPKSWAYYSTQKYEYNMGKAKELLSKSQEKDFKVTLSTTQDLKGFAENIKSDWENIGVKTEIKIEENVPETFEALLILNRLEPDPDQYSLWHSSQKQTNITKIKDAKIDKLLEDGRGTSEESKRKEFYVDFQKAIIEQSPASFLYYPYKYVVTYKNISKLFSKLPKNL
ncbi:MAG: hypothetical protein COU81_01140 [Candidatus Portnoybacteria bacterium CG10_big_fil_rev_8_21_14_0_10_36_7]|uniref:Solute-binding protein family 5 domain-containing protein n=1 Tax=Candidatus Portnoybacteria bacterium CG10_big_fil_rev_8_21_14_0_10_36_7 TaxID=1974812 RepID=A0A2M8KEK7_9BACT|nr:MAG: hypothetical protein COU81_01140 [Candidatus Portnoybacteria bacterium CG10_big_fil_rev_8_21_14_0_10_36_7]